MRSKFSRFTLIPFMLVALAGLTFAGGEQEAADSGDAQGSRENDLVLWDVQTATTLKEIVDRTAQDFRDDHPDVNFEVVHVQNDPYKTKLTVAMGADAPPDIFHSWGGGPLKAYVDAGKVYPINDLVESLQDTHINVAFDPVTFQDNTYGVPYAGLTGVFVWYRKDIFEDLGLEVPTTWSEFIEVGETLKRNDIVPLALANASKWTGSFYYMYLADRIGGADMFVDAYAGTGSFTDSGYIRAGEMVQELVERDFFPQGFNGMEYDTGQSRTMLYGGRAGMMVMGTWILGAAGTEAPDVVENLGVFNFPAVEDGEGDPSNLIGSPGQGYLAISQESGNKQAAKTFLREYVMNERWIDFMAENGFVPPVQNAASFVDDPLLRQTAQAFEDANHVQVYYDQYLPPEIGETHKDLVQALFGLEMTPEEVAQGHQVAYDQYMADQATR